MPTKPKLPNLFEAGKPIQAHDKAKLDEAMDKIVEQGIAEAEKCEVPTPERELVPSLKTSVPSLNQVKISSNSLKP